MALRLSFHSIAHGHLDAREVDILDAARPCFQPPQPGSVQELDGDGSDPRGCR
jgi:hypothetical protein